MFHECSWNGWGVTLVDALDTLILMGLNAEYRRALQHVETIDFTADVVVFFVIVVVVEDAIYCK